jgi:integral membrane protein
MPQINQPFLKLLRTLSLTEGVSTLILFFIAMPLKYLMDMPQAVSWPGRIHGGLFVVVLGLSIVGIKKIPISPKLVIKLLLASFIPFGPFVVDRELKAIAASDNTNS